jgi:fructuronate reductase
VGAGVAAVIPRLAAALLDRLPARVERPGYDRRRLGIGMAHVGVGAFHRCHQAEFTDDMLARRPGRWGVVGINIRPPRLAPMLGAQAGLYTRLLRTGSGSDARVIGCLLSVIDAQDDPEPALVALAAPEVEVVTVTVTEKGYCHRPSDGCLDPAHPDVVHDLAHPTAPRSLPGLLVGALERRMVLGKPLTVLSCDNLPANGRILAGVVAAMAAARAARLADWIAAHAAFPSTMVDRIVPATTPADAARVEAEHGYRDTAVVGGEPFRQWVIEDRFAGRRPPWDLAGAAFVADVTPFERLKMRVLNAAQTTLSCLGVLVGHRNTSDAAADPLLAGFVRAMLVEESLPTLGPTPGVDPHRYVEQSLARLRNPTIRHHCHQIATDGSRKIVQRLVTPAAERLARGAPIDRLAVAIAAAIAYLVRAAPRFGAAWPADDPEAGRVAALAARIGRDPAALAAGVLGIDTIFAPHLAGRPDFRDPIAAALAGLLSDDPLAPVRRLQAGAVA